MGLHGGLLRPTRLYPPRATVTDPLSSSSQPPPFVDLGFARVDTDRRRRCGFPEVIFCQGKTPDEVAAIARTILAHEPVVLGTRAGPEHFAAVAAELPSAKYHARGVASWSSANRCPAWAARWA